MDLVTDTVTWSDELCRIWGVNRENFGGNYKAVFELVHPDDREFLAGLVERAYREHEPYFCEHRIILPDGEVRVLQSRGAVVVDNSGRAIRMVGIGQDITERKHIEEALRERERFIRQVAELSPVVLDVFDLATGRYSYFSGDSVSLFGYTPDELANMNDQFAVLVHPEDMPRMKENIERLKRLKDGEINEFECRVRRRDGEWPWMLSRSMVFARNERREVWQEVNATFDITEQKRAEEVLRASEERLRLLVESAEDYSIITLDTEGGVSGWNSGAVRMFGYAAAEIIGRSGEILFTPEDRERGIPVEEMRRAREEGRASDERYYFRKDRTRFFASGVMAVLRDHNGQGYVKIARDLTERKQAEEALRRALEELEQRVVERTRQLTTLNEELAKEIADPQRAQEELRRSEAILPKGSD